MTQDAISLRPAPVTVVIPAHDSEATLAEAIHSVWAQSLPVAELVVVDDGSSDGTAALAERLGARVERQRNSGVSAARNRGIRAATQPYVAFLDADDAWMPDKVRLQWRAFELCPQADFCFTDLVQVQDDEVVTGSFLSERHNFLAVSREDKGDGIACCEREALAEQFLKGNFISPSTLMVRRTTLFQIGLFDETLTHCEDRELCLRLIAGSSGAVVERPLARYRIHAGGASRDGFKMRMGAAQVAARVFAAPLRYPTRAREYYQLTCPTDFYRAGILAMDSGDVRLARQLLWSSLWRRPRFWNVSVWLVSLLGSHVYFALRGTKRRFSQRGLKTD